MYSMVNTFGLPHLFVTLSPYDTSQPIIVLNISPQTIKEDGLFGRVKAYCGCTEDQERCSLYEHVLIWLVGGAPDDCEVK